MTNPFEDEDDAYLVLVNDEAQYSLWPESIDVPAGWTVTHGPDTRPKCLEHIGQVWTDMRPRSLSVAMDGSSPFGRA